MNIKVIYEAHIGKCKKLKEEFNTFSYDDTIWTKGGMGFDFITFEMEKNGLKKGEILKKEPQKKEDINCYKLKK
jgi:hypothetical protein